MRKIIWFVVFLIIIFVVNLAFYLLSDDYKFFLKKIKDKDNVVYLEDKVINDKLEQKTLSWAEIVELSKENEKIFGSKSNTWSKDLKAEIALWQNYQEVINLFSKYDLKKLELNSSLFDLTNEYPDNYFEYYSKDVVLYLFPTKTYSEVYDIFSVLDKELPFTLNQLNNFWDNSFYINLNKDIEDRFTRLVISNKWVVFWLKIKKTEYSLIKEKLDSLKPKLIENTDSIESWTWAQVENKKIIEARKLIEKKDLIENQKW